MTVVVLGEPVKGYTLQISQGTSSLVSAVNLGSGYGLFTSLSGSTLQLKSLIASTGLLAVNNTNDITFSLDTTYVNNLINTALGSLVFTPSRAIISNSSTGALTVSSTTSTQIGYLSNVTSDIQAQINAKQDSITGGATSISSSNLSANLALISSGTGKVAVSSVTATELGYLSGVTSLIQNQLNSKQATITGAASTVTTSNLAASKILVSDGGGKIAASAYDTSILVAPTYLVKIIPMVWAMQSSPTLYVPHGLNKDKIRFWNVTVIPDPFIGSSAKYDLNQGDGSAFALQGSSTCDATYITLNRKTGGFFDSANFASAAFYRGHVTILYES